MDNFEDNKIKLIESLKRLEFAIIELIQNKTLQYERTKVLLFDKEQENLGLRQEIEILVKENRDLKKYNDKFIHDIDFAIKVTENIITRLKDENQSQT